MESALAISQIVFYWVFSLTIIILLSFRIIIMYRLVKILKTLQAIAGDIRDVSDEAKERIKEISEKLSLLPIFSFFMKKEKEKGSSKRKVEKDK